MTRAWIALRFAGWLVVGFAVCVWYLAIARIRALSAVRAEARRASQREVAIGILWPVHRDIYRGDLDLARAAFLACVERYDAWSSLGRERLLEEVGRLT